MVATDFYGDITEYDGEFRVDGKPLTPGSFAEWYERTVKRYERYRVSMDQMDVVEDLWHQHASELDAVLWDVLMCEACTLESVQQVIVGLYDDNKHLVTTDTILHWLCRNKPLRNVMTWERCISLQRWLDDGLDDHNIRIVSLNDVVDWFVESQIYDKKLWKWLYSRKARDMRAVEDTILRFGYRLDRSLL